MRSCWANCASARWWSTSPRRPAASISRRRKRVRSRRSGRAVLARGHRSRSAVPSGWRSGGASRQFSGCDPKPRLSTGACARRKLAAITAKALAMTTLPLSRFKVIDLTRARAGPTCARILGDWGADVIKVEAKPGTGGDDLSGARLNYDFQNLHRNKRSLVLDLKQEDGRKALYKLAGPAAG